MKATTGATDCYDVQRFFGTAKFCSASLSARFQAAPTIATAVTGLFALYGSLLLDGYGSTLTAGGAPPEESKRLIDFGTRAPAFLVMRSDRGITDADQMSNVVLCGRPDGGLVDNKPIEDHFAGNRAPYRMILFENGDRQLKAFQAGQCDAVAVYDYYDIARVNHRLDAKRHVVFPLGR